MSAGLMQQLAEYGAFHDEEQGHVELADVLEGSSLRSDRPTFVTPSRSRLTGAWVAVAAAVITLLLVGLVPLFTGNGDPPVADTVVPTTLVETTSTTRDETAPTTQATEALLPPEVTVDIEDLEGEPVPVTVIQTVATPSLVGDIHWTVIEIDGSNATGDVVSTAFGFGALGPDGSDLLVSENGIEWLAVPSPLAGPVDLGSAGNGFSRRLRLSGDLERGYSIYVYLAELRCEAPGDPCPAGVGYTIVEEWYSTDFLEWESVPPSDDFTSDLDLVLVDTDPQVDAPPGQCGEGVRCGFFFKVDQGWVWTWGAEDQNLWTSIDGQNWQQVDIGTVVSYDEMERSVEPYDAGFVGYPTLVHGNVILSAVDIVERDDLPPLPVWFWIVQLP